MINKQLQDELQILQRLLFEQPNDVKCFTELSDFIANNAGLVDLNGETKGSVGTFLHTYARFAEVRNAECFIKHGADPLIKSSVSGTTGPVTALFYAMHEGEYYRRMGYHSNGTTQDGRIIAGLYIDAAIRLHGTNTGKIIEAFTETPYGHKSGLDPKVTQCSVLTLAAETGMLSKIFDLHKWQQNISAFSVLWQYLPKSEREKVELHNVYDQISARNINPEDKQFLPATAGRQKSHREHG
jgi:hypothetical protein